MGRGHGKLGRDKMEWCVERGRRKEAAAGVMGEQAVQIEQ